MGKIRAAAGAFLAGTVGAGVIAATGGAPAGADQPDLLTSAAHVATTPGSGQLVVDWTNEFLQIEKTPGLHAATVHPTRNLAIVDAAIEDAVVSTTHEGQPYLFSVTSPQGARPDVAAAQAAHDSLLALYPSAQPQVDQLLNSELASIPGGPGKDEAARVGHTVAQILLALRANDGSAVSPSPFVASSQPGSYRPTPPGFATPQFTNWGSIRPFVLNAANQFRPEPPPPLTSPAYANAINEVQNLGQDVSTTRSADETQAARFWNPPIWNTWNEITSTLVTEQRTDLERTAKIFSDLNLSLLIQRSRSTTPSTHINFGGLSQPSDWRTRTEIQRRSPTRLGALWCPPPTILHIRGLTARSARRQRPSFRPSSSATLI